MGVRQDRNRLQEINLASKRLRGRIYKRIIDLIDTLGIAEAYKTDIIKETDYLNLLQRNMMLTVTKSTQIGLGNKFAIVNLEGFQTWYLKSKFENGNLSERIRDAAEYAEQIVKEALQIAIAMQTNWISLSKELNKINFKYKPEIRRNVRNLYKQILQNPDIYKTKKFKDALRQELREVENLAQSGAPNKRLKNAYKKLIKRMSVGADEDVLKKAFGNLLKRKIEYYNERIARTELARAYSLGFRRQVEEDEFITAYKWILSPRHPVPDICDVFANMNNGKGKGIYTKNDVVTVPAHPNCLCMLQAISIDIKGIKKATNERFELTKKELNIKNAYFNKKQEKKDKGVLKIPKKYISKTK